MVGSTQNARSWTSYERGFAVLTGLFVTFVVLTNTVGVKLFEVGGRILPVSILNIFGPVWRLLLGSMAAYLLAQMIDSVIVNVIFLYKNPAVFSGSVADLAGIVLSVYVVKVVIAAADTPLCYLGVRGADVS